MITWALVPVAATRVVRKGLRFEAELTHAAAARSLRAASKTKGGKAWQRHCVVHPADSASLEHMVPSPHCRKDRKEQHPPSSSLPDVSFSPCRGCATVGISAAKSSRCGIHFTKFVCDSSRKGCHASACHEQAVLKDVECSLLEVDRGVQLGKVDIGRNRALGKNAVHLLLMAW